MPDFDELIDATAAQDGGAVTDVASRIRAAILGGEYSPNEHLIEGELVKRFGASSRADVRSALMELTSEGLVEREANRGARVRVLTPDEAIEICQVRGLLEGLCAAQAAKRITDEESGELHSIISAMEASVEEGNLIGYSDLNEVLHRRIREIGQHKTASSIVHRLRNQSARLQFRLALVPGRPSVSLPEHREIVEAIVVHDATAAESAMRAHIASVIGVLGSVDPHSIR